MVQDGTRFTKTKLFVDCAVKVRSPAAASFWRPVRTFLATLRLCHFFSFTPPGSPPDDAVTSSAPRGYRQWTIHPAAGTSTVPAPSSCPRQVFTLRHSSYQIASRMRAEGSAWRLFNILRLAVHLQMVNLAVGDRHDDTS